MIRFTKRDFLVFFVCFCILLFCAIYLYKDFFPTREIDLNKEKQGFITFKYKIAQVKPSNRMIWEDAEQMLPIYNLDSIRTDDLSEAIVTLNNGLKIELDPDSMFILNIQDKKLTLDLKNGSFLVSGSTDPNTEIKFKSLKMKLNSAEIKLSEKDKNIEVSLLKGKANLDYNNSKREINEKERILLDSDKKELVKLEEKFEDLNPEMNSRFFSEEKDKELEFSFKTNLTPEFYIEFSKFPNFKEIFLKEKLKESSFKNSFQEGIYYWRIVKEKDFSNTNKFRVIENSASELIYPTNNQSIFTNENKVKIRFLWNKKLWALNYKILISKDENFTNIIEEKTLTRNAILFELEKGKYYWKVESSTSLNNSTKTSKILSFHIDVEEAKKIPSKTISSEEFEPPPSKEIPSKEKVITELKKNIEPKISKPIILFPKNSSTVDMNNLDALIFQWTKVAGAKAYNIQLLSFTNELIFETEKTVNTYTFKELSKLDVGSFQFQVTAIPGDEKTSSVTSSIKFNISLGKDLSPPEILVKEKKE